ncbi:MAG: tRNA pseudouridine(38-40) synthase TruA [Desulfobacteraceae bacterium]|nr:MAG: tRNA pseudouridine(38-40) synthase TruA [Desulfobacteraceae bacterium]
MSPDWDHPQKKVVTVSHYYLVHIQYLGFRYHGWQKQPGVKTLEGMVEKTCRFLLGDIEFRILGTSRTDALVSAAHSAFELFVDTPLDPDQLIRDFNLNLPNDIRAVRIERVDQTFSIINAPRVKEYAYLFCCGQKPHPFSASLMAAFHEDLDIRLMQQGARLFEGKHDFRSYCTQPRPGACFQREILVSRITDNTLFTASFFPEQSWVYHVHAKGFLRNQVRLIMGHLISLGKHEIGLADIERALKGKRTEPLRYIAPASGLILNRIRFT